MPPCPVDRSCSWSVGAPSVHHDWWTTWTAPALIALALLLLALWLVARELLRARNQRDLTYAASRPGGLRPVPPDEPFDQVG